MNTKSLLFATLLIILSAPPALRAESPLPLPDDNAAAQTKGRHALLGRHAGHQRCSLGPGGDPSSKISPRSMGPARKQLFIGKPMPRTNRAIPPVPSRSAQSSGMRIPKEIG